MADLDPLSPKLEAWRRKLLDLSRRNRLLHFRPTRRTTIVAGEEVPAEVYRQLVQEGKALRFAPAPPGSAAGSAGALAAPALAAPAPRPAPPPGKAPPGKEPAPASDPSPAPPAGLEVAASPRRCPYCHEEVSAREEALVCAECLSRHHAECWGEHGRCASCGAGRALVEAQGALPGAAAAEPPSPNAAAPRPEGPAWVRVAREALSSAQADEALLTALGEEELGKTLLALHRAAALTLEEQGFSALFLALGFLEWVDSDGATSRAPILLVPVELRRRGLTTRFTLLCGEDDPLLNPALAHKLEQEQRISLPELADPDELDPDDLYEALARAVAHLPGWRVNQEVVLGLFSFTKLVMYRDLEQHREQVLRHPLVRRLLGAAPTGGEPASAVAPEEPRACVLDADGSQLEAIAAVLSGRDLVLEGPPGTGKSQTIANLIAELLGRGRTVLFVSEKMAALEVVRDRLAQAGVGEACLELHSKKANKRALVQELARTLELERPPDHAEDDSLAALDEVAGRLDALARALHAPWGAAGKSPWELLEGLVELHAAPEVPWLAEAGWRLEDLRAREAALAHLASRSGGLGDPAAHPCRLLGPLELGRAEELGLQQALDGLLERALPAYEQAARELEAALRPLPFPGSLRVAERLLADLPELLRPGRPSGGAVHHPAWDGALPQELIELRARLATLEEQLQKTLGPAAWELEAPLELALRLQGWQGRWWRFLAPSFWSDRGRARAVWAGQAAPEPAQLVAQLTQLARAQELRHKLAAREAEARALFEGAWDGPPAGLREWTAQVQRLRQAGFSRELLSPAVPRDEPRAARALEALASAAAELRAAWAELRRAGLVDEERGLGGGWEGAGVELLRARLSELRQARERWREWTEYAEARARAAALQLEPFLAAAAGVEVPPAQLVSAFRRATLATWLDLAERERPELRRWERGEQERLQGEFRRLDERRQELARVRLRHTLAAARPDPGWEAAPDSELGLLQRELRRKRGHLPVRQLLARIPAALTRLKPCLLMSPLTVALFTDPRQHQFDLVVFDEASQIAPEDALGAIARGRQVVVVGDGRQLPPTAFFRPAGPGEGPGERAAPGLEEPDLESVLDECLARAVPRRMLRWHYRSRHESLIAFSNHAFYGGRLCSFPSPNDGHGRLGLRHVLVEGAVYERGGSGKNPREAEAVAEAVVAHLRADPQRSLGVGAFSQAQQVAIQDAVEARVRGQPELEALLAPEREEHFFVKNLENLQGDERDVVLISIGYGPDREGKLALNFGPLNQAGGERRLNVLVTRAREQVVLFTSFSPEALDPARTHSEGVRRLREYLDYAARGTLPADAAQVGAAPAPATRPALRAAIKAELEAAGHRVQEELGTSDVRLDLAVRAADARQGHALGLLLDGPRWAGFTRARDRERLVPALLADQGWQLATVHALDWHRHRRRAREALLQAVGVALERAAHQASLDQPSTAAAPRPAEPRPRPATIRLRAGEAAEPAVRPYRLLEVAPRGDSEAFARVDQAALRDLIVQIVEVEGPIHLEELERRALAHWELTRGGKAGRERVGQAVAAAERAGRIRPAGEFLWPAGSSQAAVRDRSQSGPRAPELIPPEELEAALRLVLEKEVRVPRESLIVQAARLLGFPRGGARIRAALEARLDALLAGGGARADGGVVVNSPGS